MMRERFAAQQRAVIAVLCALALFTACREQTTEKDPVTETNVPRPTNEVEPIPGVTNPPPR